MKKHNFFNNKKIIYICILATFFLCIFIVTQVNLRNYFQNEKIQNIIITRQISLVEQKDSINNSIEISDKSKVNHFVSSLVKFRFYKKLLKYETVNTENLIQYLIWINYINESNESKFLALHISSKGDVILFNEYKEFNLRIGLFNNFELLFELIESEFNENYGGN